MVVTSDIVTPRSTFAIIPEPPLYSKDESYLVLLAQVLDSPRQRIDFSRFALHHLANVHGDIANTDSVRGHVMSSLVVQVRRMEQSLHRRKGYSNRNRKASETGSVRVTWSSENICITKQCKVASLLHCFVYYVLSGSL